jgi:UDP-N-acetylglucosamine 2-epimerase
MVQQFGLDFPSNLVRIAPVGILDMVALLDACRLVITDSGGLQKEAYLFERPTVTLRNTTEWVETITAGWNRLCEPEQLVDAVQIASAQLPSAHPPLYGTEGVGHRIVGQLAAYLKQRSSN